MNQRQLFLLHVAQTSPNPLSIEIDKAEGCLLWDADGKKYIDLIAGISVCNVGHCHPKVIRAIQKQVEKYLHVLVYGELIETPQVQFANFLVNHLPPSLNSVYFTNSGAEATEGAMKLAKKARGRTRIVSFKNAYHGSTQGALSIMGDEYWRNEFRPLLPDILHLDFNSNRSLEYIDSNTAAVIAETVQGEAGVFVPSAKWIKALARKCKATGALLILDEIQTGFGRTGNLWAFEQFGITPDILLLGKALGGGMPLGAFIADKHVMMTLTENPVLGHITTFGGHPVCCAAGLAAMKVLLKSSLVAKVKEKSELFISLLKHPAIKKIRASGLLIALQFENAHLNKQIIDSCINQGLLTDWFLFAPHCMRIAPPLTISKKEIRQACEIIISSINFNVSI